MPINWNSVPDSDSVGAEMLEQMRELWSIPRSLTGAGVRETLRVLSRDVPIELVETPSGTPVFDWVVPEEWTIRDAWVEAPDGSRVIEYGASTLHVLGYSEPVDVRLTLDELREHVFTHPDDRDLVPYRTSYWDRRWGVCMSQRQLDSLAEGHYRVVVDATIEPGSLTLGELRIPGSTDAEFLLSTYVCHPALANDNLSGVVLLWALARTLLGQELAHTFRILWGPGTLGPLCWLARNLDAPARIHHGLTVSCVGDSGPLRYKRSRRGDTTIDRAAAHVVGRTPNGIVTDWMPLGGDERQFCSPGFDLPVGAFSRTPHGHYPEYHSSADDLELVTAGALAGAFRAALEILDVIESNAVYANRSPYGEPQLGRRGLYQSVPDGTNPELALLWVLSLSDGATDLLSIAERSGLTFAEVHRAAAALEQHRLVEPVHGAT